MSRLGEVGKLKEGLREREIDDEATRRVVEHFAKFYTSIVKVIASDLIKRPS